MRHKLANLFYALATVACAAECVISATMLGRMDLTLLFGFFFIVLCFGGIADYKTTRP